MIARRLIPPPVPPSQFQSTCNGGSAQDNSIILLFGSFYGTSGATYNGGTPAPIYAGPFGIGACTQYYSLLW